MPAKFILYVGTYTDASKGNGQGIHSFEMDPATGALTPHDVCKSDNSPSWLAINREGTHLYSANESKGGTVSAWSLDRVTKHLTLLNTVSSEGAGPTHLDVHPAGKHIFVANYAGGASTVLPIIEGGKLGKATDVIHHQGKLGPIHATSAPPGSFAISGHESPHAHMIQADPTGNYILATDLALDQIYIWKFDPQKGKLLPHAQTAVPPGDGPRHFAFHPNGRWLYVIQEEASTLIVFDYKEGHLTQKQSLSTLPKNFEGTNFTSEVRISPDGKFLYAANRLHNTLAWFTIAQDGKLTLSGEEWTRGDYPRSFTIDPTGNYLYICNQRSDAIATFRVAKQNGSLTFKGEYKKVGSPSMAVFL